MKPINIHPAAAIPVPIALPVSDLYAELIAAVNRGDLAGAQQCAQQINGTQAPEFSPLTSAFTVLLMYPDYLAASYGENWCGTVRAANAAAAITRAQMDCMQDNPSIGFAEDLLPIAVFAGDHQDLAGEAMNARIPAIA